MNDRYDFDIELEAQIVRARNEHALKFVISRDYSRNEFYDPILNMDETEKDIYETVMDLYDRYANHLKIIKSALTINNLCMYHMVFHDNVFKLVSDYKIDLMLRGKRGIKDEDYDLTKIYVSMLRFNFLSYKYLNVDMLKIVYDQVPEGDFHRLILRDILKTDFVHLMIHDYFVKALNMKSNFFLRIKYLLMNYRFMVQFKFINASKLMNNFFNIIFLTRIRRMRMTVDAGIEETSERVEDLRKKLFNSTLNGEQVTLDEYLENIFDDKDKEYGDDVYIHKSVNEEQFDFDRNVNRYIPMDDSIRSDDPIKQMYFIFVNKDLKDRFIGINKILDEAGLWRFTNVLLKNQESLGTRSIPYRYVGTEFLGTAYDEVLKKYEDKLQQIFVYNNYFETG